MFLELFVLSKIWQHLETYFLEAVLAHLTERQASLHRSTLRSYISDTLLDTTGQEVFRKKCSHRIPVLNLNMCIMTAILKFYFLLILCMYHYEN